MRVQIGSTASAVAPLDGLAADVPAGQHLAGLHLVEEDLWPADNSNPNLAGAAAATEALMVPARELEYALPHHELVPQVIATTAEQTLEWVDEDVVTGREEVFSHLDAADAIAAVTAADAAFGDVAPLATQVAPSASAKVSAGFAVLASDAAALGRPEPNPTTPSARPRGARWLGRWTSSPTSSRRSPRR